MSRIAFDAETIKALAATAEQWGLTEIEMRDGDTHLRITRAAPVAAPAAAPATLAAAHPTAAPPASAPNVAMVDDAPPAGAVPSPMVGIAYLATEPGAAPFVTLGQTVTAGQTLLLIEAMKTFNQVKAPRAGTVSQILVATGQPVEYGQSLMVIA